MNTLQPYLTQLLHPLQECFTPEVASRIAALRADQSVQSRLEYLASRNSESTITPEERSDYESLVQAGNLIAVLQAQAREVIVRKQSNG